MYNDKQSTFEELLERDKSVTIHHSNIRKLAIKTYKIKNNLSPEILNGVIGVIVSSYNLRSETIFKKRNVHTVRYGTETITFLAPKIWEIVPTECKNSSSIHEFMSKIKQWTPTDCPCRLCKRYISHVGFL